jgi:biotin carboxyl carrier protein
VADGRPYPGGIAALTVRRTASLLLGLLLVATGCTTTASTQPVVAPSTTATTVITTTTTTAAPTTTLPPTTTTTAAPTRWTDPQWSTMASVGGIAILHPSARIERVGFHQSNHEGARELEVAPTAVQPVTLESRERLTSSRTAADVVVEPGAEIRSPVTGTVKRAGTYTLYCKYSDDYLVIAPDVNPAWEVKLLHINGVAVRAGDRVEAGVTVVAPQATQLPFESQVDEARTADPAWPHVHIEVVDPSIPNVASPGGGC